jgi:hypothetical protein
MSGHVHITSQDVRATWRLLTVKVVVPWGANLREQLIVAAHMSSKVSVDASVAGVAMSAFVHHERTVETPEGVFAEFLLTEAQS